MDLSKIPQSAHVKPLQHQAKPVGAKDVDAKAMAFVCTGASRWNCDGARVMMKQTKYHRKLDGGFNPIVGVYIQWSEETIPNFWGV